MVEHIWAQERLLHTMLLRLGLDIAVAARLDNGECYRQARTTCIRCSRAAACQAWLADKPSEPCPPSFCKNSEFFRACRKV
jgi:hypothetical protein